MKFACNTNVVLRYFPYVCTIVQPRHIKQGSQNCVIVRRKGHQMIDRVTMPSFERDVSILYIRKPHENTH